MTGVWQVVRRIARRVWFRAAVFTIAAVFALAAGFVGRLVPFRVVIDLGQGSVGTILQILATSMLTVTTFSLTAMVTAYSAVTTTATPRAMQLMLEDTTSQNALSSFVGAFAYSLVGIIALSTGYYTDQGRTILFFGTLLVVGTVVVTLLRWIGHLTAFGRVADVIDRVERAASGALERHARHPYLGAAPLREVPSGAWPVLAERPGYVTAVNVRALQRAADDHDLHIFVTATPGRSADASRPLAMVTGREDDRTTEMVRSAFGTSHHRDYDQDPRIGVIALAEIAGRALSPATNDPGTAIEVLGSLQRVLTTLLRTPADVAAPVAPRVHVRAVELSDLLEDAFRPISRDGAGTVEVAIRLQKSLGALAATASEHADLFRAVAEASRRRADAALDHSDRRRLATVVAAVWPRASRGAGRGRRGPVDRGTRLYERSRHAG